MLSERIKSIIVDSDKSIIQTMKLMDDSQTKSLLVFKDGDFMGMITNGDLQRAIIANKPFSLPISELVDNESKIKRATPLKQVLRRRYSLCQSLKNIIVEHTREAFHTSCPSASFGHLSRKFP